MSNLACFRHPTYKGEAAPDLACKTCCGLFVSRIRAEQNKKYDELKEKLNRSFTPFIDAKIKPQNTLSNPAATFDSSWI